MPTIAFVCPKGGVGKTTSALLCSTALATLYDVTIVDADPNYPIKDWAAGGNAPPRLTVVSDIDEETIIEAIEDAASKTPFVVVDLEGTASKIVVYAISLADLVVIPLSGSDLDAKAASRAVRVVLQSEKLSGKRKPFAVLFTQTAPTIRSRILTNIRKNLMAAGIPMFATELNDRDAFKAIISFQQTLDGLNPLEVPNIDKAKLNVWELVQEMVQRLKAEEGRAEGEHEAVEVAGVA